MNSIMLKNLQGITATSIEKYLSITGWTRDLEFRNPRLMVFSNNEDTDFRIAIPADEHSKDFYSRVYDIIISLSDYQSTPIEEIIEAVKSVYIDRIQFRIITEATENGKIPLSYAAQCIEGLKDLVLYAACAEEHAKPVCSRTCNNAKLRLDKFEFAQTEVGSFIFNVDVPVVEEENEQTCIGEFVGSLPETPEHKIVKRIEKAICQIDNVAISNVRMGDLVEDGFEEGITANMCDAFYKLKPDGAEDIEVETTIRYAHAITRTREQPIKKSLGNVHFAIVDEISKRYKDRTLTEDVSLRGVIRMLSKESTSDGEVENTVKLLARVDNRLHPIKIHLPPNEHALACDAYRDDKEVLVEGTIDKSQKSWFFTEVTKFEVIQ